MKQYEKVGAIFPCKIIDKNGNLKKIIYPKDMDTSYRDTISMHYSKYHTGKKKPPTIVTEDANI
jgi:hypothetical protein